MTIFSSIFFPRMVPSMRVIRIVTCMAFFLIAMFPCTGGFREFPAPVYLQPSSERKFVVRSSWINCGRGPNCYLRDVCFPVETTCINEKWCNKVKDIRTYQEDDEVQERYGEQATSKDENIQSRRLARLVLNDQRLLDKFDPFKRRLYFFESAVFKRTVIDQYNLENLYVEPNWSDSEHMRRIKYDTSSIPELLRQHQIIVSIRKLGADNKDLDDLLTAVRHYRTPKAIKIAEFVSNCIGKVNWFANQHDLNIEGHTSFTGTKGKNKEFYAPITSVTTEESPDSGGGPGTEITTRTRTNNALYGIKRHINPKTSKADSDFEFWVLHSKEGEEGKDGDSKTDATTDDDSRQEETAFHFIYDEHNVCRILRDTTPVEEVADLHFRVGGWGVTMQTPHGKHFEVIDEKGERTYAQPEGVQNIEGGIRNTHSPKPLWNKMPTYIHAPISHSLDDVSIAEKNFRLPTPVYFDNYLSLPTEGKTPFCPQKVEYLFMLYRPSSITRRKPYGNFIMDDIVTLYQSLDYFGVLERLHSLDKDKDTNSATNSAGGTGKKKFEMDKNARMTVGPMDSVDSLRIVLLVDAFLNEEEMKYLEMITPRKYILTRFSLKGNGDVIHIKSWGEVIVESHSKELFDEYTYGITSMGHFLDEYFARNMAGSSAEWTLDQTIEGNLKDKNPDIFNPEESKQRILARQWVSQFIRDHMYIPGSCLANLELEVERMKKLHSINALLVSQGIENQVKWRQEKDEQKRQEAQRVLVAEGLSSKEDSSENSSDTEDDSEPNIPVACLTDMITGFGAGGHGNSDEIHNHLSTPAMFDHIDIRDTMGLALSLGLDRGGSSVPNLLGIKQFLIERQALVLNRVYYKSRDYWYKNCFYEKELWQGLINSLEEDAYTASLVVDHDGKSVAENQLENAPKTAKQLVQWDIVRPNQQRIRIRKILVSMPCCPKEYLSEKDVKNGKTEKTKTQKRDSLDWSRLISQYIPDKTAFFELSESLNYTGKITLATDNVLVDRELLIPGNEPRDQCTEFYVWNRRKPGERKSKSTLQAMLISIVRKLNRAFEHSENVNRFKLEFVSSCEFMPMYWSMKHEKKDDSAEAGNDHYASFSLSMIKQLENVDILFSLAGFDNYHQDALTTQMFFLKKLASVITPFRSNALHRKNKEKIDDIAYRHYNMENMHLRQARTLPLHHGVNFELRRTFRHRPYLKVEEIPMFVSDVEQNDESDSNTLPEITFSWNFSEHSSFLRRVLLDYQAQKLGIQQKIAREKRLLSNRPQANMKKIPSSLISHKAYYSPEAIIGKKIVGMDKKNQIEGGQVLGLITKGGQISYIPEVLTNITELSDWEAQKAVKEILLTRSELNPQLDTALIHCEKNLQNKDNIGEYCYTQIWAMVGCSNLPLQYGGSADLYKWYYKQNFKDFVADSTTWATSIIQRHWRICYVSGKNPHAWKAQLQAAGIYNRAEKEEVQREEEEVKRLAKMISEGIIVKEETAVVISKGDESSRLFKSMLAQPDLFQLDESIEVAQAYSELEENDSANAHADNEGLRNRVAVNNYTPGVLGYMQLRCPRRAYQQLVIEEVRVPSRIEEQDMYGRPTTNPRNEVYGVTSEEYLMQLAYQIDTKGTIGALIESEVIQDALDANGNLEYDDQGRPMQLITKKESPGQLVEAFQNEWNTTTYFLVLSDLQEDLGHFFSPHSARATRDVNWRHSAKTGLHKIDRCSIILAPSVGYEGEVELLDESSGDGSIDGQSNENQERDKNGNSSPSNNLDYHPSRFSRGVTVDHIKKTSNGDHIIKVDSDDHIKVEVSQKPTFLLRMKSAVPSHDTLYAIKNNGVQTSIDYYRSRYENYHYLSPGIVNAQDGTGEGGNPEDARSAKPAYKIDRNTDSISDERFRAMLTPGSSENNALETVLTRMRESDIAEENVLRRALEAEMRTRESNSYKEDYYPSDIPVRDIEDVVRRTKIQNIKKQESKKTMISELALPEVIIFDDKFGEFMEEHFINSLRHISVFRQHADDITIANYEAAVEDYVRRQFEERRIVIEKKDKSQAAISPRNIRQTEEGSRKPTEIATAKSKLLGKKRANSKSNPRDTSISSVLSSFFDRFRYLNPASMDDYKQREAETRNDNIQRNVEIHADNIPSLFDMHVIGKFSHQTCHLGPNCYFRNVCFQQFENHDREVIFEGHVATKKHSKAVDFIYVASQEEHVSMQHNPKLVFGELMGSPNFPSLAIKQDEVTEFRVHIATAAKRILSKEIDHDSPPGDDVTWDPQSKSNKPSSDERFLKLNKNFRNWKDHNVNGMDFNLIIDFVNSMGGTFFNHADSNQFARTEEQTSGFMLPRIISSHPMHGVTLSGQWTNVMENRDYKLIDKGCLDEVPDSRVTIERKINLTSNNTLQADEQRIEAPEEAKGEVVSSQRAADQYRPTYTMQDLKDLGTLGASSDRGAPNRLDVGFLEEHLLNFKLDSIQQELDRVKVENGVLNNPPENRLLNNDPDHHPPDPASKNPFVGVSDPDLVSSNDPNLVKTDIAIVWGRYKCCTHNVGHVLLDEVISIFRYLQFYGLLDRKKYRYSIFLETLRFSEYFRLVGDYVFTWNDLPKFGCFAHVIMGEARFGYYNPHDWHQGMKDTYDVLVRNPKSAPYKMMTLFRNFVLEKYGLDYSVHKKEKVLPVGSSNSEEDDFNNDRLSGITNSDNTARSEKNVSPGTNMVSTETRIDSSRIVIIKQHIYDYQRGNVEYNDIYKKEVEKAIYNITSQDSVVYTENKQIRIQNGPIVSLEKRPQRLYNITIFQKDSWKSENCCVFVNAEAFRDMLLNSDLPIDQVRLINWVRKKNLSWRQMLNPRKDMDLLESSCKGKDDLLKNDAKKDNMEATTKDKPKIISKHHAKILNDRDNRPQGRLAPRIAEKNVHSRTRTQCLGSEYSMVEQLEIMSTTDILISFSGADMANLVFLPEKAAIISFSRYLGYKPDLKNMGKQPGWRTSFELASWGRHKPYLIRKEIALEGVGLYNIYNENYLTNKRFSKETLGRSMDANGTYDRETGAYYDENYDLHAPVPVFMVKPRREGGLYGGSRVGELYYRFGSIINETSHPDAKRGSVVRFLHMSDLNKLSAYVRSCISELETLHAIRGD